MSEQATKQSKFWLVPATVALALSWADPASAKQEYYDALIEGTFTCADCRLCHSTAVGTASSLDLTKPFALYMVNSALKGSLPAPTQDSDGDGISDLDELNDFGDPNDPTVGLKEFECPGAEYGCVRVAKQKPKGDALLVLSSLLVAFGLIRRRRRRR